MYEYSSVTNKNAFLKKFSPNLISWNKLKMFRKSLLDLNINNLALGQIMVIKKMSNY